MTTIISGFEKIKLLIHDAQRLHIERHLICPGSEMYVSSLTSHFRYWIHLPQIDLSGFYRHLPKKKKKEPITT